MDTKIIVLEDYKETGALSEADLAKLKEAGAALAGGALVAFPTETVYGLGGNALDPDASRRIYAAKGRPSDNPLIVHISALSQLGQVAAHIPETARRMAERFWPGPLTMVFQKAGSVPAATTGGLPTVAVRFPSHPAARALIGFSGTVIAAPSANLSGRPSTTTAAHCVEDLAGRVDLIIDGGDAEIGLESTILDVSGAYPVLLRPGAVTAEMIRETLGALPGEDAALKGPLAEGVRPKAPGMKYRHYAPKAPMVLVTAAESGSGSIRPSAEGIAPAILRELRAHAGRTDAKAPAVLCSEECLEELRHLDPHAMEAVTVKLTGHRGDAAGMAHRLFELLREMDAEAVDFIVAEGCPEREIGSALMNRLKKAAAWQILYV